MEIKEVKDAIEAAALEIKAKADGAAKEAKDALLKANQMEAELKEKLGSEQFKDEIGKVRVKMADGNEYSFQEAYDLLQKQHNALSAKVNTPAKEIVVEKKSFSEAVREALEENQEKLEKFNRKEIKSFDIELKAVGDMSTANVTGGSRYGQVFAPNIIQNPNRKVHIDELLPGGNIGPGNTFTFMRENGVGEGNPAPTAEGATKPQFDYDLVEATVNVETIAGWMRVTRKAMQNIPGFMSFLQNRIPERFKRVLDAQILYGNGTTPNLKGILTTGNFVASGVALDTFLAEKITQDIAVLEDTYERDATGVLLRPIDIATFYRNKATGSGEYDLPRNVEWINGRLHISGVPVYATTALNAPDYVVGDWANGAQLLTQNAMRIEFFEQDGTNVRENKVTIRVEGDYALPVYGGDYFIKGSTARSV